MQVPGDDKAKGRGDGDDDQEKEEEEEGEEEDELPADDEDILTELDEIDEEEPDLLILSKPFPKPKLYDLVPMWKFKRIHIPLTNSAISRLFSTNLSERPNMKGLLPLDRKLWPSITKCTDLFHFPLGKGERAGNSISTDGVSITFSIIPSPTSAAAVAFRARQEAAELAAKKKEAGGPATKKRRASSSSASSSGPMKKGVDEVNPWTSEEERKAVLQRIQLKVKSQYSMDPRLSKGRWVRVIGVDPGLVILVSVTEVDINGRPIIIVLSSMEYKNQTHAINRRLEKKRLCVPIIGNIKEVAATTSMGVEYSSGLEHFQSVLSNLGPIMKCKMQLAFAKLDYIKYECTKKVLARFFGGIQSGSYAHGTKGMSSITGYGAGSYKSRFGAPTTTTFKACVTAASSRRWKESAQSEFPNEASKVSLVPEFRTSKYCSCCGHILQHIRSLPNLKKVLAAYAKADKTGEPIPPYFSSWNEVRGLVRCVNVSCARFGQFWHRDHQAALGIREITICIHLFAQLPLPFSPTMDKTTRMKPPPDIYLQIPFPGG